ncbi:MAG: GumC family protein, partial [Chitinophagaceae bacterium]
MSQTTNEQVFQNDNEGRILTFKDILFKYISNLPLFFFALGAALITAWAYLRWATPIYSVSSSMIVKVENAANIKGNEKFSSVFNQVDKINMEDEIELMRSKEFLSRVVETLHLNNVFIEHGKVRSSEVYQFTPFNVEVVKINDSLSNYGFNIQLVSSKGYLFNKETKLRPFYSNIEINGSVFRIVPGSENLDADAGRKFTYAWKPSKSVAGEISGSLAISQKSRNSSVLNLSLSTLNPEKGKAILNQIMNEYGTYNVLDKSRISKNSLDFINSRLDKLENELGIVEGDLQDFKKRNQFLDMEEQSKMYFDRINSTEEELRRQEVQIKVLDLLDEYIQSKRNRDSLIPSTLFLADPTLSYLVSEYNRLIIKKGNELRLSKPTSPVIKELDYNLEKTRNGIIDNLKTVKQSYVITRDELYKKNKTAKGEIFELPEKESQIREIKRQQAIKNELFTYLLQKREETGIQLASVVSNSRVFAEAEGGGEPFLPKRKNAYMLAIFFGILIPVIIILVRDMMNDRVTTKNDIIKYTKIPIIGELGHNDKPQTLVVVKNSRTILAEQFRIIRSNLQYLLKRDRTPVILITSSFSGEGKSFAATNLAASIALTGKKTVLLEFDLRKPKVLSGLGLQRTFGITHFVVGKVKAEELPVKVPETDNLYVVGCGPTPPNPSELLLDPKIKELFEYLKDAFDVVVVDTAPVGLVSDSLTLSNFADASLFVVRQRYTYKKQLQLLDELYQQKK